MKRTAIAAIMAITLTLISCTREETFWISISPAELYSSASGTLTIPAGQSGSLSINRTEHYDGRSVMVPAVAYITAPAGYYNYAHVTAKGYPLSGHFVYDGKDFIPTDWTWEGVHAWYSDECQLAVHPGCYPEGFLIDLCLLDADDEIIDRMNFYYTEPVTLKAGDVFEIGSILR